KRDARAVAKEIEATCRAAGLLGPVRVVAPVAMDRAIREAVASGADTVVIGGGDGTVRTAAQALAGTRTTLGVLPLGTLNHYARDLGVPTALEDAARALATAEVRAVDVGDLDGSVFVNNSAIGLYPYLVRVRERDERRWRLGRLLALI